MIRGQEKAVAQFRTAWDAGTLHHAWLLAGPRGVGKGTFAYDAAVRVLADAAGPREGLPGLEVPDSHPVARLIAAGSHPDLRVLQRLENEKTGNLARNISVDQVRSLGDLFDLTPALSPWRAVIIDAADDLEGSAANALLKMLEEPPSNCLFLLVAHAPGRLLPTIRSRCRRLEFQRLDDDAMAAILSRNVADMTAAQTHKIIAMASGSASRAMAFAELDLAPLEEKALGILRDGDPTNARRSELAQELGRKGAGDRYAAFLELVPTIIAREARAASGGKRARALDAYDKARELAAIAPRVSLDPAATIFQLGGILASVP
ncbi:MAG TPA: DNA polymerase III subunit delta' [Sphingomicrobium sp.]|nr:DNA polymerase III subunit delta' [Sphingomicrobium sp.]